MSTKALPRIYVDSWSNHGTREEMAEGGNSRVKLHVQYGDKQATIEMPAGQALFEREPGAEIYRRELHALLEALDAALKADGILWPPREGRR